jgi:hypothetical protein
MLDRGSGRAHITKIESGIPWSTWRRPVADAWDQVPMAGYEISEPSSPVYRAVSRLGGAQLVGGVTDVVRAWPS